MMHLQAFPKKKHPAVAVLLTLLFGPLGYFYIGWRYAVAALVVFAVFILVFSVTLIVPPWLKYLNILVFAFMAIQICQIRNTMIEAEHPDAFAFNTMPVAIFAMTTMLPILAAIDTAGIGIFIGIRRMVDGEIGKGMLILLVATPLLAVIHLGVLLLIATGIDWLVLQCAPNAPTNTFPTPFGRANLAR